jgi:hypothetical protein
MLVIREPNIMLSVLQKILKIRGFYLPALENLRFYLWFYKKHTRILTNIKIIHKI